MRSILRFFVLLIYGPLALSAPQSSPLFETPLRNVNGQTQTLAAYRGQPLLVNFWARWCAPCRTEIPWLQSASDKAGKQVTVIGIGLEEDVDAVQAFSRSNGMRYPVFLAADQAIPLMKALGNKRGGLPFTVMVDREGRIVDSHMGLMKPPQIEAAMQRLQR